VSIFQESFKKNFNEKMKKHGEQAKRNRRRAIIKAKEVKITF